MRGEVRGEVRVGVRVRVRPLTSSQTCVRSAVRMEVICSRRSSIFLMPAYCSKCTCSWLTACSRLIAGREQGKVAAGSQP